MDAQMSFHILNSRIRSQQNRNNRFGNEILFVCLCDSTNAVHFIFITNSKIFINENGWPFPDYYIELFSITYKYAHHTHIQHCQMMKCEQCIQRESLLHEIFENL